VKGQGGSERRRDSPPPNPPAYAVFGRASLTERLRPKLIFIQLCDRFLRLVLGAHLDVLRMMVLCEPLTEAK